MRLALVAVVALSGCARYDGTWTVWHIRGGLVGYAEEVPESYRAEIAAAARVIAEQQGIPGHEWGGDVYVADSANNIVADGVGTADGKVQGPHRVFVVYDPSTGNGPGVGTTAIEHELCHAARMIAADDVGEAGANACALAAYSALTN